MLFFLFPPPLRGLLVRSLSLAYELFFTSFKSLNTDCKGETNEEGHAGTRGVHLHVNGRGFRVL